MKIFDVPLRDCEIIARNLGIRFAGDDVSNRAGIRVSGRLVPDGDNPYQRISSSPFVTKSGEPRKVSAICWHGYRDFMRAVFNYHPDARIQTGKADYCGAQDFEDKHRDTGYINIGSMMYSMTMVDACSCKNSGDVG